MKIEILIQCHNFQKRLCWMLSSIMAQSTTECKLLPSVASLENNGNPTTEEVVKLFKSNGFRVKHVVFGDKDTFAYRGNVRNLQVKALDNDTDWVLFTDSDMVYEEGFFNELHMFLSGIDGSNARNEKNMYSIGRLSSEITPTDALVEGKTYPCIINDFGLAAGVCNIPRRNCGAGYFQLVRAEHLDGIYVKGRSRDRNMFEMQKARSDIQFRKRFKLIKVDFEKRQFHLNHVRDNQVGYHLEVQR